MIADTHIKVEEGQTIWDIAVKQYGDLTGVRHLIEDNQLSDYNSDVAVGTDLVIKVDSKLQVQQSVSDQKKQAQKAEANKPDYYVTLESQQNIWDVAIQEYGSILGVQHLVKDNPKLKDYNDNLYAGLKLKVKIAPENIIDEDKAVMNFYRGNKLKVATGETPLDGIPYMIILDTFIVQ